MHLDIPTLLVAVALVTAFCAAARVLLWRMHPHVPGLAQWAWAGMVGALALSLFAARRALPDAVALSLAQVMVATGLLLSWDGFRRFLGRRPLATWQLLAMTAAAAFPIVVAHAQSLLALRTLTNASVVAVLSALMARELRQPPRPQGTAARAVAYIYAANAAFFLLRGALSFAEAAPTNGPLSTLALLWWMCIIVAVTLGMALMTGERLQADLDRQASRDPLTGALNRRAFTQEAEREVARARRLGSPLSVLMMDLDHFKQINDHLGHAAGDDILRRFVAVAGHELRAEDVFCRFGGEEFVALLPATDTANAMAAAERLRSAFAVEAATLPHPAPAAFAYTVSIGVSQWTPTETLEGTLRRADGALYQAKALGRNRCQSASPVPAATT